MGKSDYLKECMNEVAAKIGKMPPIDVFNKEFCIVCPNSTCARSKASTSLFQKRVDNWRDDLFLSVPRADDSDPTYENIRAQKFLPISANPHEIRPPRFISPNMPLEEQITPPEPVPEPALVVPEPIQPEPPPIVEPKEEAPEPIPPPPIIQPPPSTQPQSTQRNLGNTAFNQGMVLGGGDDMSRDVVLEPGQSFVFGSSDD